MSSHTHDVLHPLLGGRIRQYCRWRVTQQGVSDDKNIFPLGSCDGNVETQGVKDEAKLRLHTLGVTDSVGANHDVSLLSLDLLNCLHSDGVECGSTRTLLAGHYTRSHGCCRRRRRRRRHHHRRACGWHHCIVVHLSFVAHTFRALALLAQLGIVALGRQPLRIVRCYNSNPLAPIALDIFALASVLLSGGMLTLVMFTQVMHQTCDEDRLPRDPFAWCFSTAHPNHNDWTLRRKNFFRQGPHRAVVISCWRGVLDRVFHRV
mmetsp:Transcript_9662/g.29241  ORF Transcript_9662/g.29241 Transcript_9662/m.29241 type:complete len:262 (-) Transcript_9662:492-1277(-)